MRGSIWVPLFLSINSDKLHAEADLIMTHSTLHALDLTTGKEVWSFVPPGTAGSPSGVNDPTVYDGMVYAASSFWADTGPGYVYAFDAKTGKQVWKHTTADQLWNPQSVVAFNSLVYVASDFPRYPPGQRGEAPIYALDAKTGEEKWTFRGGEYLTAPSISDGVLYVAGGYQVGERGLLFAIDPATGKQLKRLDFENGLSLPPTIDGGVIYLVGRSFDQLGDVLLAVK